MNLLADVLVVGVVVLFGVLGWKKGMFQTMSGLLGVLVGIFVAKLIADYGSALIAEYLVPLFMPMVEEKLGTLLTETNLTAGEVDLGIFALIPGVQQVLENAADTLITSLAPAVAREVAGAAAWVVLFVVGFFASKLVVMLIMTVLNLIDNIPGLHFLNHAIGLVLGALKGFLLVLLVLWVADWFCWLPQGVTEDTYLISRLLEVLQK